MNTNLAKTVLVIDDNIAICDAIQDILTDVEIETLVAHNGNVGLKLFQEHQLSIGVILLDVNMPVMDGSEACARLRSLAPKLPIILSTGASLAQARNRYQGDARVLFLAKPFSIDQLIDQVQIALDLNG